jgi:2-iminoacetate synthase
MLTLAEYLVDYASPQTHDAGFRLIEQELAKLPDNRRQILLDRLHRIQETNERDMYF